jgi:AraC-like DNA-binding protein
LPAGAVACIPPDQPHAWGEEPGAHLAVHFDLHAQPALRGLVTIRASGQLVRPQPVTAAPVLALGGPEPLRLPLVTRLDDPAGFRRLLAPLPGLVERLASGPAPRLRAAAILAEALLRLALPPTDARQSMELEALLAAIAADPAQPWPLPALARRLGVSAPSLRRHFVRATGLPPRAWIERQRMAQAERLLLAGRPVAAVAEAVGYADAFHFSRVFRRVTGTAPSRWGR